MAMITVDDINLKRAMEIAIRGHAGQLDKRGKPYIQHLFRVAGRVYHKHCHVAMLHDYFEDVHPTRDKEEIAKTLPFLNEGEVEALRLLTRSKDTTYRLYIESIAFSGNRIAIDIKIADLEDHLDVGGDELDHSLYSRYRKALNMLKYRLGYDVGKEDPLALLKEPLSDDCA